MTVSNFETPGAQATKPLTALTRPWGHHQFQNALGVGWQFSLLRSLDENPEDFFLLSHLNVKSFVNCHFTSSLAGFRPHYNEPKLLE